METEAHRQTMTKAELIRLIANAPDHSEIVISDTSTKYADRNVINIICDPGDDVPLIVIVTDEPVE